MLKSLLSLFGKKPKKWNVRISRDYIILNKTHGPDINLWDWLTPELTDWCENNLKSIPFFYLAAEDVYSIRDYYIVAEFIDEIEAIHFKMRFG